MWPGYKTLLVNGLLFGSYALAWDQWTEWLSPEMIAMLTTVVNGVLRFVTKTPVFTK